MLRGWLEQDLRCWPHQLPDAPGIPEDVVQQLVREAVTAEEHALVLVATLPPLGAGAGEKPLHVPEGRVERRS